MLRDIPHVDGDNLLRKQIVEHASQEMKRWEFERRQDIRQQAGSASQALVLWGVALLIFLCGYAAGQRSNNPSSTGSTSTTAHETIKP